MKSSLLPVSLSHTAISNSPPLSSYRWRSNCSLHCGLRVFGTVWANTHTQTDSHMVYGNMLLIWRSTSSISKHGKCLLNEPLYRNWADVSVSTPCSCTSGFPVWTWRTGRSVRWGPWESGSCLRLARCWRSLSRAGISDAALKDALTAAAGSHTQIRTLTLM